MSLTAAEQLLIEYVNRARLDPLAEAQRYGLADLNDGLAPGTLSATAKQVLAPNTALEAAADAHSAWMLATDTFSHTGAGGSSPSQRMTAAGYALTGAWSTGENIAWWGTTGSVNLAAAIDTHHRGLFLSAGHRANILNDSFAEIGVAQQQGSFAYNGTVYNSSMLTEDFAHAGSAVFVTGVAYDDADHDRFYGIGEARQGVRFEIPGGSAATTAAAGGYALATAAVADAMVKVTAADGGVAKVTVDLSQGNVKLDLVDDRLLMSSGSLVLSGGFARAAELLGTADLALTGSKHDDVLTGNAGDNVITGRAGDDHIDGGAGADLMIGGPGSDVYVVDNPGDRVVETHRHAGTDLVLASVDVWLKSTHVENATLTGSADIRAVGNSLDNLLTGNAGDNILDGGGGDDRMVGGGGDDIYLLRDAGDTVVEAAGQGRDMVKAYISTVLADNFETLALQGQVAIDGFGNGLDNAIIGNMQANVIGGRGGADTLTGQGGADCFVFDTGPGDAADHVVDFAPGEDSLRLKGSLYGVSAADLLPGAFHQGVQAADAGDRFIYDAASGRFWVDADGSGGAAAALVAVLDNHAALSLGDLDIV